MEPEHLAVVVPCLIRMPDRFSASFDGETVRYEEHFDNWDETVVDRTLEAVKTLSPDAVISRTSDGLTIEIPDVDEGLVYLVGELLYQLEARGFLKRFAAAAIGVQLLERMNPRPITQGVDKALGYR